MPMAKTVLIAHLAETADLPRSKIATVLDELATTAYREAPVGFTLPGLGKFVVIDRKARSGRNPVTGETLQIPAKRVLKFRIAKVAKDAILTAEASRRR